jgi:hypothetical protein
LDTLKQFIVAPRSLAAPVTSTLQAVENALQGATGSRVVSSDRQTGIVVIELSESQIETVRNALGTAFIIEPNSALRY